MRERDINRKLFHAGHYEIIAARFREAFEPFVMGNNVNGENSRELTALANLALSLTRRFELDNSDFDPVRFLSRCSPDPTTFQIVYEPKDGGE